MLKSGFTRYLLYLFMLTIAGACDRTKPVSEVPSETEAKTDANVLYNFIGKDYLIDDQHSYLGFKIKYFGYSPVRGRFNEFSGTLFYDEDNLSNLSVTLIVSASSINTGNERRDKDLTGTDTWFDTDRYPHIVFQSTDVAVRGDGGFYLIGNLTIKGITKSDTIHFEEPTTISRDWAQNEQVDFSGTVVLNRQDFGVFGGDFWSSIMENGVTQLSDEVIVEIEMHCRRADYMARYEAADSLDVNKIILDKIKSDGIQTGIDVINNMYQQDKLSSGTLSSVGYTLMDWKLYEEARTVFLKRLEYFPAMSATHTQLGILNLHQGNDSLAIDNFNKCLELDSVNSRAIEYLRLYQN